MSVELELPSEGGGPEARSNPHIRGIVWGRGETFKAESETRDLWQPKKNETQTVLDPATGTLDRDVDPLAGAEAGSCSLGIVEQSQGEGCCWLQGDRRDVREEMVGNACGGKPGSHGSKGILLSHA